MLRVVAVADAAAVFVDILAIDIAVPHVPLVGRERAQTDVTEERSDGGDFRPAHGSLGRKK